MPKKDFYEALGYALPDEVGEVKSEGFEYYRHPVGIYTGLFGKLTAKYKDLNGDKCEPTTPGSYISHFIAQILITKFLGTSSAPENKSIIAPNSKGEFSLPSVNQAGELYYPLLISYDAKNQWKVHRLFEKFLIPGTEFRIVKQNPSKPTEKITDFRAFPAFYGCPVKFIIEAGKKTGSPYCSNIELGDLSQRVGPEEMNKLELMIDKLIQREMTPSDSGSLPEGPPPSATDLFGEEDLGEFVEG